MRLRQQGPRFNKPSRRIDNKAQPFLPGREWQLASPTALDDGDCKFRITNDCSVDVLLSGQELCGDRTGDLVALI